MSEAKAQPIEWAGCYDGGWRGLITPDSFQHPAKFSRGLIDRIYRYMFDEGLLRNGDTVVDPFGGVGCGGIIAAGLGLRWIGCELEEKFVELAKQNFALHKKTWEAFGDPLPVLVQGDSRRLRVVLAGVLADARVSSPPFLETLCGLGADQEARDWRKSEASRLGVSQDKIAQKKNSNYGQSPGQLGVMKAGSVDAVVSSPPYAESFSGNQATVNDVRESMRQRGCSDEVITKASGHTGHLGYGTTHGQLAALPVGQVDSVVSSPPYEGSLGNENGIDYSQGVTPGGGKNPSTARNSVGGPYSSSDDNIGNTTGDTFWAAAKLIVAESQAILKPGGWSAWVCKDFIRDKQIVPFCDDWCKLLESSGFLVERRIHAMLVKETRHNDLFDGETTTRKERKSFFRRLAEKKGSPRIDFEEVLFARKT